MTDINKVSESGTPEVIQKVQVVETPQQSNEEIMMEAIFGNDVEDVTPETTDDVTNDEELLDIEEDSEDSDEDDDSDDDSEDDTEVAEDEEVEEIQLSTLQDLADNLGVDVADLYDIEVPITFDDGKRNVKLSDWKDEVTKNVQEMLSTERSRLKENETRLQQEAQKIGEAVQMSTQLLQGVEQNLVAEINKVNWQELQQNDAPEYDRQMRAYEARVRELEQYKQAAAQHQQALKQEQDAKLAESISQRKKVEVQRLLDKIPRWTNADTAKSEMADVGKYLVEQMGFDPKEATNIIDHRLIVMAEKAMRLDKIDKAKPNKKKVVKIGKKTVKPGTSKSSKQVKADATKNIRTKAMKSGSASDMQSYFETLI